MSSHFALPALLTLAALRDRRERGQAYVSWVGAGGQPHDLEELAKDDGLQAWMRRLPALVLLEDRTLAQHCDSDELGALVPLDEPDQVAAVNREVRRLVDAGDLRPLIDRMTSRGVFRRQTLRLEAWLARTGARRVVHGHTPHRGRQPEAYAGGRAICFDGGMGRWGRPGALRGGSVRGTIAPLPPLDGPV